LMLVPTQIWCSRRDQAIPYRDRPELRRFRAPLHELIHFCPFFDTLTAMTQLLVGGWL